MQALIANLTRPSLTCRAELVPIDGLEVLAIEMPPSTVPTGTSGGKYARRALTVRGLPQCIPFHFSEMQARQASQGMMEYSGLVLPGATWDDLDRLEIERFRRWIRENQARGDTSLLELSDVEVAKALGAVVANHHLTAVCVLGLLLFGREDVLRRFVPGHEVAFQVLAGTNVEVNEFFRWPLLRVMEETLSRVRSCNREDEVLVGPVRVGVPLYPERAVREGLANALIHRDYTRLAAVHVQWYRDRLEISNPGGFPDGVRLDNLLVTPPRPRNPLLADAFKRAGIVERTARGIDTIFSDQLRGGRPPPSYERSTSSDVVLVLAGGPAGLRFARLVAEETAAGRAPSLDELLLLSRLWLEGSLTVEQAARLIQKPAGEARATLARLAESGLVEVRDRRQAPVYRLSASVYRLSASVYRLSASVYRLSASVYRRLGEKSAYVRGHGFEPIQQQQMILHDVRTHGSISRGEAAELCERSRRRRRIDSCSG